jgi:hypothetical protein
MIVRYSAAPARSPAAFMRFVELMIWFNLPFAIDGSRPAKSTFPLGPRTSRPLRAEGPLCRVYPCGKS